MRFTVTVLHEFSFTGSCWLTPVRVNA